MKRVLLKSLFPNRKFLNNPAGQKQHDLFLTYLLTPTCVFLTANSDDVLFAITQT